MVFTLEPTWAQKIKAIKKAAQSVSADALFQVNRNLAEGVEHMEYKDYTEFECSCEEEYIFMEAVHLIEELKLPFDAALSTVVADDAFVLPYGWTSPGSNLATNPDPFLGGIIDTNASGQWFVIFNADIEMIDKGLTSRKEAFEAFEKAIEARHRKA